MRAPKNPYLITGPALISFSGGRTSARMLKGILDAHGGDLPEDVKVIFCNTGKEATQTLDFVQECSERWNVPITWLEYWWDDPHHTRIVNHNSASRNGEPFEALIDRKGFRPNPMLRYCTHWLKIDRARAYGRHFKGWKAWFTVIGFRYDEPKRYRKTPSQCVLKGTMEHPIYPMVDDKLTVTDITEWWAKQPFDLNLPNINGITPNGNCDLCFLKNKSRLMSAIRADPQSAEWWIKQENKPLQVKEGRNTSENMRYFREDRPPYADLLNQGDLFQKDGWDWEGEECACTD